MAKTFYMCLVVLIIASGCSKNNLKAQADLEYPTSMYITAMGIGQSETEARKQAFAEMSHIFESSVFSNTYAKAKSVIDTTGSETFSKSIESNIRLISAVKLKGIRIAKTWFDDERGVYYALAVLDRYQDRENWQSEIDGIDSKIEGEFNLLNSIDSKFMKLVSLKKILNLWVKREVFVSRLRVLGFQDTSFSSYDIKTVFHMIPQIKADMFVFVEINGEHAREIENKVSESLNKAGFILSNTRSKAEVMVTGIVRIEPVELDDPGWEFARARVSLKIIDVGTELTVGEISENTRAGHLTYAEAVHKAVKKISKSVSDKLIEYFE